MDFNTTTLNFYKSAKLTDRKNEGQYMTPYNIIDLALKDIKFTKDSIILEPSYGTGQFLDKIKESNYKQIYGVEKDKTLFNLSKDTYKDLNLFNDNYLTKKFDTKFDFILGNPPYFEIDSSQAEKKQFADVISGRPNIYSFFLKKGIDELKDNGELCFVIPTSLLTSKYFEKTRNYIHKFCSIVNIVKLTSDLFDDALQKTMIFHIKKCKPDNKFIINISNTIIFSPDYIELRKFIDGKSFIKDLDCSVKTGSVVWNEFIVKYPGNLINNSKSDNKDNIPLIYPRNLKNGKITLINNDKKPQYIKYSTKILPIKAPVIVINRIVGSDSISLNPVLIKTGSYYFENHINVITGSLKNLKNIKKSLDDKVTIDFIKKIIGNTQLSKTELETMIPINDYDDSDGEFSSLTNDDLSDDDLSEDDYLDELDYLNY